MPTFNRQQVLKPQEEFNPADPTPLLSKRPLLEWSYFKKKKLELP